MCGSYVSHSVKANTIWKYYGINLLHNRLLDNQSTKLIMSSAKAVFFKGDKGDLYRVKIQILAP